MFGELVGVLFNVNENARANLPVIFKHDQLRPGPICTFGSYDGELSNVSTVCQWPLIFFCICVHTTGSWTFPKSTICQNSRRRSWRYWLWTAEKFGAFRIRGHRSGGSRYYRRLKFKQTVLIPTASCETGKGCCSCRVRASFQPRWNVSRCFNTPVPNACLACLVAASIYICYLVHQM